MADKHDQPPDELTPLDDNFDSFSDFGESESFDDLSGFGTNSDSVAADDFAVATDGDDTAEPVVLTKGKKGAKAKKEPNTKPVKPAKTQKTPKARPPKEPSDVDHRWIGVLCLMVACLVAVNVAIFMTGTDMTQIFLAVSVDILGIFALAVPFLLYRAGHRYTIFDVLLGISVIVLVIGSSILLAELASYDFTFKSAAMILPFSTKTG